MSISTIATRKKTIYLIFKRHLIFISIKTRLLLESIVILLVNRQLVSHHHDDIRLTCGEAGLEWLASQGSIYQRQVYGQLLGWQQFHTDDIFVIPVSLLIGQAKKYIQALRPNSERSYVRFAWIFSSVVLVAAGSPLIQQSIFNSIRNRTATATQLNMFHRTLRQYHSSESVVLVAFASPWQPAVTSHIEQMSPSKIYTF